MNGLNKLNIHKTKNTYTHTHCVILNWRSDRKKDDFDFILNFVYISFYHHYLYIQQKKEEKFSKRKTKFHYTNSVSNKN